MNCAWAPRIWVTWLATAGVLRLRGRSIAAHCRIHRGEFAPDQGLDRHDRQAAGPDQDHAEPLLHYEDLLAAADTKIDWPEIDETSAYSACYTTGTTGKPKGVYYLAPRHLPALHGHGHQSWA